MNIKVETRNPSMTQLVRQGYGSSFNELFILDDRIVKIAKNEYGKKKIATETALLKFILEESIPFSIPTDIRFIEYGYSMKFYKDWKPLYRFLQEHPDKLEDMKTNVLKELSQLHSSRSIQVSRQNVQRDLLYELQEKLVERHKEIKDILEPYSFIETVNGISLVSFAFLLDFLKSSQDFFIETYDDFWYTPIHGDCQFNNVLVSPDTKSLVFIDPRGSFGKSAIYGLREYDLAKVKFALTGYDIFDSSTINSLSIEGSNLILPEIAFDLSSFFDSSFSSILTLSIWLGNPHSFKEQPLKAVYSYYYGLYLGTLLVKHLKSGTK